MMDAQQLEVYLKPIHEKLDRCVHVLEGNGTEGLRIKVDRLQQAHKDAVQIKWIALVALAGVVTRTVADWITSLTK